VRTPCPVQLVKNKITQDFYHCWRLSHHIDDIEGDGTLRKRLCHDKDHELLWESI
jgi:hypothetical protein